MQLDESEAEWPSNMLPDMKIILMLSTRASL